MPKFRIQAPDGNTFDVEGPEGSTAEQALAQVQAQYKPPSPDTTVMGGVKRQLAPAVGAAETVGALGSGVAGSAVAGVAGLAQGAKNLFSEGMPAGDRVRQVQDALTYQPQTEAGKEITGIVSKPFDLLARGADKAGGAVTDLTGSPLLGAAVNTGVQALPSALGLLKGPVKGALTNAETAAASENALNAPRNAAIDKYRAAGYVLSPAEANPTILNRIVEGFSGQAKVQQLASAKSQPVTNALVRKGLGIEADTPLSMDVLQEVRKNAGNAYEDVRNSGRVQVDPEYGKALDGIERQYVGAEKDFPGMAKQEVKAAVKSARVDGFDSSSGVDAIKIQRAEADKAFRSGDTELGKAHKAIADAIEGQLERHLQGTAPDALAAFRQAREVIAKSYDVQKALKDNGNVDASVLAASMKKAPARMTGDIKTAAEFGRDFRKSAQTGTGSAPTIGGFYDFGFGGLGGALGAHMGGLATGGAGALAALFARPATRAAMTSGPMQNLLVHPSLRGPGATLSLADLLTNNPATGVGLAAIKPQSVQQHLQQIQQEQQRNKEPMMIGGRG